MHVSNSLELLSEKEILEGALNSVVFHTAQINGAGEGTCHPVTDWVADAWLICSWNPPTTESPIFPEQSSLMSTLPLWEGGFSHQLAGTDKPRLIIKTEQRTLFVVVLPCFVLPLLHICRLPWDVTHTHCDIHVHHWAGQELHSPVWQVLPLFFWQCLSRLRRLKIAWRVWIDSSIQRLLSLYHVLSKGPAKGVISNPFTKSFTVGIFRRSELFQVTQPGNLKMQIPQNDTYLWRASAREWITCAQGSQCLSRQLNIMLYIAVTCNLVRLEMKNGLSLQLLW